MTAPRDVSYDDYLTTSLTDPAEAAVYLDAAIELEDTPALLLALRQVAKAHGMAEVARRADVGDKTLFRALSETGNPTLDTVTKVLHAMGLRLSVAPLHPVHESACGMKTLAQLKPNCWPTPQLRPNTTHLAAKEPQHRTRVA